MNPEEIMEALQGGEEMVDPSMMVEESPMPESTPYEHNTKKYSDEEQLQMVQKFMRRFYSAESAMAEHVKMWKMLDLFDRGKQWDNAKIPAWIPKPMTNLIRYVRTMKRANLASIIPQSHFTPVTQMDAPLVKHLQKAYEHVWDEQKVPVTIRRVIDRGILHGTQIAYVYAEENIRGKYFGEGHEGNSLHQYDVRVKRLNNANFFPDPSAYCVDELKWATVTENLAFTDVKNNPTFKAYAGQKLKDLKYADLDRSQNGTGDIYARGIQKVDVTATEDGDEMCTVHSHWVRYRNEDGRWQVDCFYFMYNTDFLLYAIEDFKPSVLPFAVFHDEEEDNSFWGTSTAMDMLENQKIINKTAQAASIIGTLHQNPQKVVTRESGINAAEMSRTGTLAGKVWTSNIAANQAVHVIDPPDIPKGLFEIEDRMKNDIKDMSGITEAYTGQSVGSLTTSTGVDSLIERSSIRDRDKAIQIDQFVEDLSNLIAQFILVYWQEPRPIMTRQKNGDAQFDQWTPVPVEILDNFEYRVISDVYAKAPMTQAARSQAADNLMQMQGQFQFDPPVIIPEEWIDMKDFPNKEDILARMQADRQNKQQQDVQGLTQQIVQIINQQDALQAQGMSPQNSLTQIQPMIDQLVQQTFTTGTKQGSADNMTGMNTPIGTTGITQLGNMTSGM